MNINTFEKLQLNEVKELIKNYCVSSLGKEGKLIQPNATFNSTFIKFNNASIIIFLLPPHIYL